MLLKKSYDYQPNFAICNGPKLAVFPLEVFCSYKFYYILIKSKHFKSNVTSVQHLQTETLG